MPKRKYWLSNGAPGQNVFFEEALDPALWEKGDEADWDACWRVGMPKPGLFKALKPHQTINHIPGNAALTIKSRLHDTLQAQKARFAGSPMEARFGFFPRVFDMPREYHALQEEAFDNPDALWMLKPTSLSRGRGIELLRDPALAPLDKKWMVQSYLDRPHLYQRRKYVLRCYVAVTSVDPLRAYFYEEGFIKLASEDYDETALDNPYAYLTNPDINVLNETVDAPVVFISFEKYRAWLRSEGHDDSRLFQRITDMLALSVAAAHEEMRGKTLKAGGDLSGCYELLGFDCMVDDDLNPWLLECNLSPSLDVCAEPEDGGDDEARIKRALVADLVNMVGLNNAEGDRGPADEAQIAEEEVRRAGGYLRLFPAPGALEAFPIPRLADVELARAAFGREPEFANLKAGPVREIVSGDALSIYHEPSGVLHALNDTAALFWLNLASGAEPDVVATAIAEQMDQVDIQTVRRDVWETAAEWVKSGLLVRGDVSAPEAQLVPSATPDGQIDLDIFCAGIAARVTIGCRVASDRIGRAFDAAASAPQAHLSVLKGPNAYSVIEGGRVVASGVPLSALAPTVRRRLLAWRAREAGDSFLVMGGLAGPKDGAALILSSEAGKWDAIAARMQDIGVPTGGVLVEIEGAGATAHGHSAPFRDPIDRNARGAHVHTWPGGAKGSLRAGAKSAATHVRFVVAPFWKAGANVTFDPLSKQQTVAALTESLVETGRPPSGECISELAKWAEDVEAAKLVFDDPKDAASALLAVLEDRQPDDAL